MAVDSYDPTTGYPIFIDTGAPDTGVDPTEVAKYAADVGNRIVRANLAALDAYVYKRAGLAGHALDTKVDYTHDGAGWVQSGASPWVNVATFGAGWAATAGYTPQVRRQGSRVDLRGALTISTGSFSSMLTVPAGFAPTGNRWVGSFHGSASNVTGELLIDAAGLLQVPTAYRDGTAGSGTVIPIAGFWHID